MNVFISILLALSSLIIIRHDQPDQAYLQLAERFSGKICHLNLRTDVPDGEATLISPHWVLTAAHCAVVIEEKLENNERHQVTISGKHYDVNQVILHENWEENGAHDIALIHLTSPAPETSVVEIYTGDDEQDQVVYVAGMGDTGTGSGGITGNDGQLRAATNRVDEATDFWLKWVFDDPEKNPDRVTEYEGISGPGDSGGPAFIEKEGELFLAGISSGQSTRATNGVEGVYGATEYYTRVSRYSEWIAKHLNKSDR